MDDYNEAYFLGLTLRAFVWIVCIVILVGVLCFGIWRVSLALDTASQGAVRTNQNHQASQQIANNAYLHNLLGQIETDKADVREFNQILSTFCQVHHTSQIGHECKNLANVTDYNDQQEYDRDTQNLDSAYESLSNDVNTYDAYFSNSDVVGVDSTLPTHVNANGSYTDVDGTFKNGVSQ